MTTWIKYPLTHAGFRHFKCGYFIASCRIERHDGFIVVFAPKNAVQFYAKSLTGKDLVGFGGGIVMERSTILERYDWYRRTCPHLSRKRKKRIIGTKSRRVSDRSGANEVSGPKDGTHEERDGEAGTPKNQH